MERRKSRQREKTTHHNEMGCARRKSYTSAPPIMDAINVRKKVPLLRMDSDALNNGRTCGTYWDHNREQSTPGGQGRAEGGSRV